MMVGFNAFTISWEKPLAPSAVLVQACSDPSPKIVLQNIRLDLLRHTFLIICGWCYNNDFFVWRIGGARPQTATARWLCAECVPLVHKLCGGAQRKEYVGVWVFKLLKRIVSC